MLSDSRVCLNFGGKILHPYPSLRKNSACDISPSPSCNWVISTKYHKISIGSVWNIISLWITITLICIPHLENVVCWLARLYKIIEAKRYSIYWSAIPSSDPYTNHAYSDKHCELAAGVNMDICATDVFTCWRQKTTKNWRLENNRGSCSWSPPNRPSRLISFNNDFLRSDAGQRSA